MTALSSLSGALLSDGPAADRAGKMGLYAWLVGSWDMDVLRHLDDGSKHRSDGEIHFGWVLRGRAIQDVWIAPKPPAPAAMYGTTLRIYDPGIDAWHIIWSDPVIQYFCRQTGRAEGKDIVQVGANAKGEPTRWRFTEITEDSFHWIGERAAVGSTDWRIEVEFFAPAAEAAEPIKTEGVKTMLDHVSIGVADVRRAKAFYDAALTSLGYALFSDSPGSLGYGRETVALWVNAADRPVPADMSSGLHFCFAAPSRESVNAFHAAALKAGGKDNGPPGPRADYGPNYFAAFVIDPDGYRLEAYCGLPA